MTTRRYGYLVILGDDVREDSDRSIVNALWMVRGVIAVEPLDTDAPTAMAEARARTMLGQRILDAVTGIVKGDRA